jgi:hypothetical protein
VKENGMEEKKELRIEEIEAETITELPDRPMMENGTTIIQTIIVVIFNLGGGGGGGAGGSNVI